MNEQEIKEILKLIPTFIKMCENDFEEDNHEIIEPLTYKDFEKIERLITKMKTCADHVDQNIFG
jgi:hypothetical protein